MTGDAHKIADVARGSARAVAAVVLTPDVEHAIYDADGLVTRHHYFEIGSLTKPLTALLLAEMALAGDVHLDTPIGDILDAGTNSSITLGALATHTSGLPRLPGNLLEKAARTPHDPYGEYDATDLVAALNEDHLGSTAPEYSNYGYMVLGLALERAAGTAYDRLLRERVLSPAGMVDATADPSSIPAGLRVQGYGPDDEPVPHWTKRILGAGGVEASVEAMAAFVSAELSPSSSPLEIAIEMTQHEHRGELLGWQRMGPICWHNGGTGGFRTFLGFDRRSAHGVALLTNSGSAVTVDRIGLEALGVRHPLVG